MMTQQDIVLALIRSIIIIVFGLGVVGNIYRLFDPRNPAITTILGIGTGIAIVYFTWTL